MLEVNEWVSEWWMNCYNAWRGKCLTRKWVRREMIHFRSRHTQSGSGKLSVNLFSKLLNVGAELEHIAQGWEMSEISLTDMTSIISSLAHSTWVMYHYIDNTKHNKVGEQFEWLFCIWISVKASNINRIKSHLLPVIKPEVHKSHCRRRFKLFNQFRCIWVQFLAVSVTDRRTPHLWEAF